MRARIGKINRDGTIQSIYLHRMGFHERVLPILQQNYACEEKVAKLLGLGDLLDLGHDISSANMNEVEYMERSCQPLHIGRRASSGVMTSNSINELMKACNDCLSSFCYVWQENKWRVWLVNRMETPQFFELPILNSRM